MLNLIETTPSAHTNGPDRSPPESQMVIAGNGTSVTEWNNELML